MRIRTEPLVSLDKQQVGWVHDDLAYLHEVFQAMQSSNKTFMKSARESMYFYTGGAELDNGI